jgi:hypothetical protein
VRIIVGFAPGGTADIIARLTGQWLSERLGQPFIIENRPGGGTNIATEAVVRAPADGYTLLMVGATQAINATLYDKLNFHLMRDITPVAGIIVVPNVMVVSPSVPATTVPEFIAYAKANAGKGAQAGQGLDDQGKTVGEIIARAAVELHLCTLLAGNDPKGLEIPTSEMPFPKTETRPVETKPPPLPHPRPELCEPPRWTPIWMQIKAPSNRVPRTRAAALSTSIGFRIAASVQCGIAATHCQNCRRERIDLPIVPFCFDNPLRVLNTGSGVGDEKDFARQHRRCCCTYDHCARQCC